MKQQFGPLLAVMNKDVWAMESGDRNDFEYGSDFAYPPVQVDRVLRDGDTITMGDVLLTAYHTPGLTPGATTWVANVVDQGNVTLSLSLMARASTRDTGWRRTVIPRGR
jgi:metallo-beta-lactamase class B